MTNTTYLPQQVKQLTAHCRAGRRNCKSDQICKHPLPFLCSSECFCVHNKGLPLPVSLCPVIAENNPDIGPEDRERQFIWNRRACRRQTAIKARHRPPGGVGYCCLLAVLLGMTVHLHTCLIANEGSVRRRDR